MIKCIAVDDEPWALSLLENYISKVPFLELVLATEDAIKALHCVQTEQIDLVFLDIQMPEITGLQFMKITAGKCRVILTTAYSAYALDGYEYNVIDYLLKPISFDRFFTASLKAQQLLVIPTNAAPQAMPVAHTPDYIFVKIDTKAVKLLLSDILFIEGLKDYIAIHTLAERLIVQERLKAFEAGLPQDRFVRVHKSYIVSLEKIDSLERNRIFIKDQVIPVGDTFREFFFSHIKDRHFG
ncbi:LytR/AlgR family response regulator transcription factor [Taibaiella chishuiensis]|uniref:LytTR family two component transcriptional regulator n=1 Tax=Taibaiella chishuiensis TaxID=1434707 RepID=A0A2P8D317_9BACT|nr:LytTR family DNA-binding domain-containing protein [Taibaiella chishuiensis]PSK91569.1 LytTR family two component transcriptional regulator [Taibaiella chishuiensis]